MTISDLRAADLRLGMTCRSCARFRYLAMNRYESDISIGDIEGTIICSRCRSRDVEVHTVARDTEGRWPAERS